MVMVEAAPRKIGQAVHLLQPKLAAFLELGAAGLLQGGAFLLCLGLLLAAHGVQIRVGSGGHEARSD